MFFYKRCELYPEGIGPIPVVFLALGRSGSTVTWDTMSALTGESTVAYEATGQTENKSKLFFNAQKKFGNRWALLRLCALQKEAPLGTGIVGFQWKVCDNVLRNCLI